MKVLPGTCVHKISYLRFYWDSVDTSRTRGSFDNILGSLDMTCGVGEWVIVV